MTLGQPLLSLSKRKPSVHAPLPSLYQTSVPCTQHCTVGSLPCLVGVYIGPDCDSPNDTSIQHTPYVCGWALFESQLEARLILVQKRDKIIEEHGVEEER